MPTARLSTSKEVAPKGFIYRQCKKKKINKIVKIWQNSQITLGWRQKRIGAPKALNEDKWLAPRPTSHYQMEALKMPNKTNAQIKMRNDHKML